MLTEKRSIDFYCCFFEARRNPVNNQMDNLSIT